MSRDPNRKRHAKNSKLVRAKDNIDRALAKMQLHGGVSQVYDILNRDSFDAISKDKTFDSIEEVIKDIKERMHFGVYWSTQIIFTVAEVATENWYRDYHPEKYRRTDLLYDNLVVWNSGSYVSGYHGQVSVNPEYLSYVYPNSDNTGRMVLQYAEQGLHGVDYSRQGKEGVGIWGELINFLINDSWGEANLTGIGNMTDAKYGDSLLIDSAFEAGMYVGEKPEKNWRNSKV